MKYIQQWFRRLIIITFLIPTFFLDIILFGITLGIINWENMYLRDNLLKLWK